MAKVRIDTLKIKTLHLNNAYSSMFMAVEYLKSLIDGKLRMHGTGRIYKRGNRVHQASSPGMPPASDTGTLRARLQTEVKKDAAGVTGKVIAGTEYALPLEVGTEKMAARPFMRPSLEQSKKRLLGFFK